MVIKSAALETVCGITSTLPENELIEIAFAGKSNVGKSSLINALMNRKSLARTSSQPGKTQTINFYNVNNEIYFVDLPGYGYAKVSEEIKAKWGKMIEKYLDNHGDFPSNFVWNLSVWNNNLVEAVRYTGKNAKVNDVLRYNPINTTIDNLLMALFDISINTKFEDFDKLSDAKKDFYDVGFSVPPFGVKLENREIFENTIIENMTTSIKGRLYINNLSKGSYRLVSSDNKSVEFSIDEDGKITGNVTENSSEI